MAKAVKKAAVTPRRTTKTLTLTQAIDALKRDLRGAVKDNDFAPMFEITEATVEIGVSFDRTVEPNAGVNIFVVTLGAKASERTAATHKVSLKLRMLSDQEIEQLRQTGEAKADRYQGPGIEA